jgi:sulfatase modifying factor 1
MVRIITSLGLLAMLIGTARGVVISTVPVGSPGNAPDSYQGSGHGSVAYRYNIGTYDITNSQYAEFLNAKASTADPYQLLNPDMQLFATITRSGSGPYVYKTSATVANKPVNHVTWYEAVRFVNWLQNGQGNGDTESGTYTISNGFVTVPDPAKRQTWALTNSSHWLLPSEDEWYKAAYYNPQSNTYYQYPFQSNSEPADVDPPGNANSGNFTNVPGRNIFNMGPTNVGAYSASLSPFGSYDMGGNVYQWTDTAAFASPDTGVVLRGGSWDFSSYDSGSDFRSTYQAYDDREDVGFRVASVGIVPEPATLALGAIGVLSLLALRHRELWRRTGVTARL